MKNAIEMTDAELAKSRKKSIAGYEKEVRIREMKIAELKLKKYKAEKSGDLKASGECDRIIDKLIETLKLIRKELHKMQLVLVAEREYNADAEPIKEEAT